MDRLVGDLLPCEAVPVLLKQVWVNLLSNALKFTRAHTHARIRVGCAHGDGTTTYLVDDNGVAFDAAQAGELFRLFHRMHGEHEYEGTGDGLAIVERIVRRHDGSFWAAGRLDHGTTFYFTLTPAG